MKTSVKVYVTLLFGLFLLQGIYGQTHRVSFTTIEREIDLENLADPKVVYLFEDFQKARVYYPNERIIEMYVNYRLLVDDMIVKTERRGIQSMIRGDVFDSIRINDMLFIFDRNLGFIEKFENHGNAFYIKHQSTYTQDEVVRGAYGEPTPSASTQAVNIVSASSVAGRTGQHITDLTVQNLSEGEVQINILRRPVFVYFIDGEPETIINRRQLNRLFPDHRSDIRAFLRNESISFDERDDLIRLGNFLTSLE
ncbi:MAG: hypothetical protein EA393_05730 [Bacteroidetes bacterium]|nr:MAG: hypothetical protein EA393_05730 [Bacteroidota bacterium]